MATDQAVEFDDGLAAMLPVSFKRCIHLIAELALTSTHSAASRRDAPRRGEHYDGLLIG